MNQLELMIFTASAVCYSYILTHTERSEHNTRARVWKDGWQKKARGLQKNYLGETSDVKSTELETWINCQWHTLTTRLRERA